jgi:very-short-patch-repair endonuclease
VEYVQREKRKARLHALARRQFGLFTYAQAVECGLPRSTLYKAGSRDWELVLPRVFRFSAVARSYEQGLFAVVLWAGPESCVSHRAAGKLWGLDGCEKAPLELSVPRSSRAPHDAVILHRGVPSREELQAHDRIPVTSVARTLLDLGAVVPRDVVEKATRDALRRRLTAVPVLEMELQKEGRQGRAGAGVLRAVVASLSPAVVQAESVLELRLLDVLERAGFRPVAQHAVVASGRRYRLDFALPQERIALEADGKRTHFLPSDWEKDLRRRNALTVEGWCVLHFSWDMVRREPGRLVEQVQKALSARRGGPRRAG